MHRSFERMMHMRYGQRYDLTRDIEGFYCRETVKRMFEIYCWCMEGKNA
ncbi:hypothetical protein CIG19_18770 [Enterobacterales bacterium CwR94]|nr:hypothetical protein CIG19_18770 [Enterobacterales bacterium CwR94]